MNYYDAEIMRREQVKDYLREVQRDRLAAKAVQPRAGLNLRCWLSSRLYYLGALVEHWARRIRQTLPAGERVPAVADCR